METLTSNGRTAAHSKATRLRTILAGTLAATMLAVSMFAHLDGDTRARTVALGAAPVPTLEGGHTIALDDLGDAVVADLNTYWNESFANAGLDYAPTAIIYFEIGVLSGCGIQLAEIGPFYCPLDHLIYLPAEFFVGDIRTQDFAVAAVIAHEVGHHVQNLVGILAAAHAGTITSVQLELQADCLAGVWTADFELRGWMEPGDYREGVLMFASIGDDAMGIPADEADHGTSEQRVAWYDYGYVTADGSQCVTY